MSPINIKTAKFSCLLIIVALQTPAMARTNASDVGTATPAQASAAQSADINGYFRCMKIMVKNLGSNASQPGAIIGTNSPLGKGSGAAYCGAFGRLEQNEPNAIAIGNLEHSLNALGYKNPLAEIDSLANSVASGNSQADGKLAQLVSRKNLKATKKALSDHAAANLLASPLQKDAMLIENASTPVGIAK